MEASYPFATRVRPVIRRGRIPPDPERQGTHDLGHQHALLAHQWCALADGSSIRNSGPSEKEERFASKLTSLR